MFEYTLLGNVATLFQLAIDAASVGPKDNCMQVSSSIVALHKKEHALQVLVKNCAPFQCKRIVRAFEQRHASKRTCEFIVKDHFSDAS